MSDTPNFASSIQITGGTTIIINFPLAPGSRYQLDIQHVVESPPPEGSHDEDNYNKQIKSPHTPCNSTINPHHPHAPVVIQPVTPSKASTAHSSPTWPDSGESGFIGARQRPYDYETPSRTSLPSNRFNGTPSPIDSPAQPLYRSLFPSVNDEMVIQDEVVPTSDDAEADSEVQHSAKRRRLHL